MSRLNVTQNLPRNVCHIQGVITRVIFSNKCSITISLIHCHKHFNAAGYCTAGLEYGNTTPSYTLHFLQRTCNCNTNTSVNTASAACWSTSNESKLIAIIQFTGLAVLVQKLSLRSNQFSRSSIRAGP